MSDTNLLAGGTAHRHELKYHSAIHDQLSTRTARCGWVYVLLDFIRLKDPFMLSCINSTS